MVASGRSDRFDDLTEAPTATPGDPSSRIRILVVDDDRVTYRLLFALLEKQGYEVDTAGGGVKAIELMRAKCYDLVLLDVEMPAMSGLEVARAIRSLPSPTASLPVVGLTAHEDEAERAACLRAGMDGVLSKPVKAQELFQAIERWLKFPAARRRPEVRKEKPGCPPVVDLEEAAARCANDLQFVSQLLEEFVSDAPRRLRAMAKLAENGSWTDLAKAAHQLKGAAGNLSVYRLADVARRLEEACNRESRQSVVEILAELREAFAQLAEYTSKEVGTNGRA